MALDGAFARMRSVMVERDLRGRGITDERVLEAMGKIPRERFVDPVCRGEAYADHPLPIGSGQTISQPYMVALMTQCLELSGGERVLEIGTGSGYQTAVLAELAAEVFSVERLEDLASRAGTVLKELGYGNVRFKVGDGSLGWEEEGPFDRVIVTCAAPEVPEALVSQLAPGGVMVIPVGKGVQELLRVRKTAEGEVGRERVTSCVFVPLVGKEGFMEKDGGRAD